MQNSCTSMHAVASALYILGGEMSHWLHSSVARMVLCGLNMSALCALVVMYSGAKCMVLLAAT